MASVKFDPCDGDVGNDGHNDDGHDMMVMIIISHTLCSHLFYLNTSRWRDQAIHIVAYDQLSLQTHDQLFEVVRQFPIRHI